MTFQTVHCLSLDISNNSDDGNITTPLRLEEALDRYFAEEEITSDASDRREVDIRKRVVFEALPQVLVLQLNRFSFDFRRGLPIKITRPVEYPATIDVKSSWLCDELSAAVAATSTVKDHGPVTFHYDLTAIVLHQGNKATAGHYTAICKDVIDKQTVRAKSLYLLFPL